MRKSAAACLINPDMDARLALMFSPISLKLLLCPLQVLLLQVQPHLSDTSTSAYARVVTRNALSAHEVGHVAQKVMRKLIGNQWCCLAQSAKRREWAMPR